MTWRLVTRSRALWGLLLGVFTLSLLAGIWTLRAEPGVWRYAWPQTDFSRHSVELSEILDGGPAKDGIPSIDRPHFERARDHRDLTPQDPVIRLVIRGEARAYPLRILIWHEIVNDELGGLPVAVTYCPLCNSALVFDRRVAGEATEFGTTGKLRKSDMVMYDRTSESWWQQFLGEAIVGEHTGTQLDMVPARLVSWREFLEEFPDGQVLIPNDPNIRPYGMNPYAGYDSRGSPYFPTGPLPDDIAPLARVVKVGEEAWSLDSLRAKGRMESGGLVLTWQGGQASALDDRRISAGRDVGSVTVQRRTEEGLADAVHDVTFAFVFHAFHPDGVIHQ